MAHDETRLVTDADRSTLITQLLRAVDQHEADGLAIAAEMNALGIDAKRLKQIRAAKKTLDALVGSDLLPEGSQP